MGGLGKKRKRKRRFEDPPKRKRVKANPFQKRSLLKKVNLIYSRFLLKNSRNLCEYLFVYS